MSDIERGDFMAGLAAFTAALPPDIRPVAEVQATQLRPTDIVILRYPHVISEKARSNIAESWRRAFEKRGEPAPLCLVLEEGVSLDVLRRREEG